MRPRPSLELKVVGFTSVRAMYRDGYFFYFLRPCVHAMDCEGVGLFPGGTVHEMFGRCDGFFFCKVDGTVVPSTGI